MSKTNRTEAAGATIVPTFKDGDGVEHTNLITNVVVVPPATHKDDPLLNLSEAARRIGKAQPTVRRWIAEGLMKAIRLPSGLFAVRESAVNDILRIMEK